MVKLFDSLTDMLGRDNVLLGASASSDYYHDEALGLPPSEPAAIVFPSQEGEVAAILAFCYEHSIPVTARGSGTGLSGAALPPSNGVLISFERMNKIIEIDTPNHVAVVQPGVTLAELDKATARVGLTYPVFPGELSATIGGNIATNAGGMRAIKYGVTRHNVLGLRACLPTGEIVVTGGKFTKATSGYDLTQLIIGSEGTLALVTEATLALQPRPTCSYTILAPFERLTTATNAVPHIINTGVRPLLLEYIDNVTMVATTERVGLDLGLSELIKQKALAYLLVVLEGNSTSRLEEDGEMLAGLLGQLEAMDGFVLPDKTAAQLIQARESAFFVAKAYGVQEIMDAVVPRASIPRLMEELAQLAQEAGALIARCGHAGDGNIHLSVFLEDSAKRHELVQAAFQAAIRLGGAISAEHGIGREKRPYFLALEDPVKIALMRRIKSAFDPKGILNPGVLFDPYQADKALNEPKGAVS